MIILVGGSGYVGKAFQALFHRLGLAFHLIRRGDIDWHRADAAAAVLKEAKASFLFNAAGYTGKPNVDACERHKRECLYGNAVLPGLIDEACRRASLPWGHVSSGCIYTGSRLDGTGFRESDSPNFCFRTNHCSFYSGTKGLGEELLADSSHCYVWRLRIPFNEVGNPRNYLTKLMRYDMLLDAENSLSQLDDFVRAAYECYERKLPFGFYNVTNPGSITTREVVALIEKYGICRKPFKFFQSEAEFMRVAAIAPRSNCVLDSTKITSAGITLRPVHEAVEWALKHWNSGEHLADHQGSLPGKELSLVVS